MSDSNQDFGSKHSEVKKKKRWLLSRQISTQGKSRLKK